MASTLAASAITFCITFYDANQLQDDVLRGTAALLNRLDVPTHKPLRDTVNAVAGSDYRENRVIVRRLAPSAEGGQPPPHFAIGLADGLHEVTSDHTTYRVLVKRLRNGTRVAVAQQTAVRNEQAISAALGAVLPGLIALPLLLLVVTWAVRHLFAPITRMTHEIDNRGENDLSALNATELSTEIQPFIDAINRLLARVASLVVTQRRFIAAAAHELRTPLAALSIQAEHLDNDRSLSASSRQRLLELRRGIKRNQRLVNQLLTLARSRIGQAHNASEYSVETILREIVGALLPLIEDKRLDVNVQADSSIRVCVPRAELESVVTNLLGNAITYTPNDGRLQITVWRDRAHTVIEVEDSGPGLSDAEKSRVVDPFWRGKNRSSEGAGLGLAIVESMVSHWPGELVLTDSTRFATGLKARVRISMPPTTRR